MGVSQQEWQVADDGRPAFSARYRLTQPSSTGIHRGAPGVASPNGCQLTKAESISREATHSKRVTATD